MANQTVSHGTIVWQEKPYITPLLILRSVAVFVVAALFLLLEFFSGIAYVSLGLPLYVWTIFAFILIWIFSILHLLLLRISNTSVLRQDGLEVRRGIIRLHSFVVTP